MSAIFSKLGLLSVGNSMDKMTDGINSRLVGVEPWKLVVYTAGSTVVFLWVWDIICQDEPIVKRAQRSFFRFVRSLPIISQMIRKEVDKHSADVEGKVNPDWTHCPYVITLPKQGLSEEELMKKVDVYLETSSVAWNSGRLSGAVYNSRLDLLRVATDVYRKCVFTNPLHPDAFPGVCKMEAEVVTMTANLFHGGPEACGTTTSGGTESILLACKAYRDRAIIRGISRPHMIVPVTVHAAFDKAAHYLGMTITHVPVDERTWKVDVKAMARAITRRTCMLVGSAPNYPHGIIDPIKDISELGLRYGIPVHVDACLGGFVIAFMDKAGFPLEPFDFRLQGVTSISADTHKYGLAPKGSSVIMYRNREFRHYQYSVHPDWPGGIYGTTTIAGSRSGGIIAACWATLMTMGEDKYVEATRNIIQTARYIREGLKSIPSMQIVGDPQVSVVAFVSSDFHIFHVFDGLVKRGWHMNRLQFPSSIHFCVTDVHTQKGVADDFLNDVRMIADALRAAPQKPLSSESAVYGMSQTIPDREVVGELVWAFLDGTVSVYPDKDKDETKK